ncbi:unnamed protein product [Diplocarpon coronariae]
MTPVWILPVLPIMLCGNLASLMGSSQPPNYALPILVASVTFQGLGMMIATLLYGAYMSRLMTNDLPSPITCLSMFIAVESPSFKGLAVLGISQHLHMVYPSYTTIQGVMNPDIIAQIFRVATALWLSSIASVSVTHGALSKEGMSFHLFWWTFVFSNVGSTIVAIDLGNVLMSEGVNWHSSVMTILTVAMWLFVDAVHIRAVWKTTVPTYILSSPSSPKKYNRSRG